jgi:hypothetical protein
MCLCFENKETCYQHKKLQVWTIQPIEPLIKLLKMCRLCCQVFIRKRRPTVSLQKRLNSLPIRRFKMEKYQITCPRMIWSHLDSLKSSWGIFWLILPLRIGRYYSKPPTNCADLLSFILRHWKVPPQQIFMSSFWIF